MSLRNWIETNLGYGRKLVSSSLHGANSGRQEFLQGEPLAPFLGEAARTALKQASLGACIGVLSAYASRKHRPTRRAIGYGILGGAIGFGTGITWKTHRLTASVGRCALKKMNTVRDERWLERHPIDYA